MTEKVFEIKHSVFPGVTETFSETTAPDWLTSKNTVPGSTMDNRWFWRDHVLMMDVGSSIDSDFHTITRVS